MECSPCPRTVQSSSTKKWSRSCWRSWQRRNQRKVPRGWSCCEGGPPWHHHHHHHHRRPNKTRVILHLQCVSKYGVTIIVLLFCCYWCCRKKSMMMIRSQSLHPDWTWSVATTPFPSPSSTSSSMQETYPDYQRVTISGDYCAGVSTLVIKVELPNATQDWLIQANFKMEFKLGVVAQRNDTNNTLMAEEFLESL